jgi:LysR family hydrogen peroxide-inducible transcriptional activator
LEEAQIRLGIMCTVGPARFMSFLAGFHATNPGCEITLVEGVPAKLSNLLLQGELDLAVMAQPEPFNERLDVLPLYDERFCIAFPTGHRLDQQNRVEISDVAGETYLRRINCEYRDYLADQLQALGLAVRVGFQSEREDWIQMMVAAGFGVCFLPEFSPTIPGVRTQPVTGPEVTRKISLVSMSGRRFSPAVMSFTRAIRSHSWLLDGGADRG